MSTTTRRLPAALTLVALTGAGAGCGSAGAPSATSPAKPAAQGKAVRFAECLRGHGVPHFPDPDAKGDYDFGVDVSAAVWRKATSACKDLQPPGTLSSKRTPKQQSASLTFARCIRANGVKDFPDPVNGEPLIDTTQIPSSGRPGGMTILNAAIKRCPTSLSRAAGGQG